MIRFLKKTSMPIPIAIRLLGSASRSGNLCLKSRLQGKTLVWLFALLVVGCGDSEKEGPVVGPNPPEGLGVVAAQESQMVGPGPPEGPGAIYPLPTDSSPLNDSMSMPEDSMSMLELNQATEMVWGAILGKKGLTWWLPAFWMVCRLFSRVSCALTGGSSSTSVLSGHTTSSTVVRVCTQHSPDGSRSSDTH